ncbi:ABC transporter ATP-binding protein [Mesorhizobium sp. M0618]|uniref:ABC transporter ATP-binding protein n=1 Tax=unclassified Mesorhizobium TaxID=325217 RepID=UPI00333CA3FB
MSVVQMNVSGQRNPRADAKPVLELHGLSKSFGAMNVVKDVSLDVWPGEFVSLLGPSGCGKTTTLRMIAGFIPPNEGRIILGGKDITEAPSYRRDVGLLFQSYALFPHMTVRGNVGFGPKMRGATSSVIADKVRWALSLVKLEGYEDRRPNELSGGQQQRVAIARVLAGGASMLLLDEAFSNLDAKLRGRMQEEVRELQLRLGIATVLVTHDQEEALAMSDRIVIMNGGKVEQIGTPKQVYSAPSSLFVADFMGRCNRIEGTLRQDRRAKTWYLDCGASGTIKLETIPHPDAREGEKCPVFVRPEHLSLTQSLENHEGEGLKGRIDRVVYLGSRSVAYVTLEGNIPLQVHLPSKPGLSDEFSMDQPVVVVPLPGAVTPLPE